MSIFEIVTQFMWLLLSILIKRRNQLNTKPMASGFLTVSSDLGYLQLKTNDILLSGTRDIRYRKTVQIATLR